MEQAYSDLVSRNVGLYDDKRFRLPQRPQPKGQGFEDLGSDFSQARAKTSRKQSRDGKAREQPDKSLPSQSARRNPPARLDYLEVDSDNDMDPLDLLSSSHEDSPVKIVPAASEPDYMKDRSTVYKSLKFKKTKSTGLDSNSQPQERTITATAKENDTRYIANCTPRPSPFSAPTRPPTTYANRSKASKASSSLPLQDSGPNNTSRSSNASSTTSSRNRSRNVTQRIPSSPISSPPTPKARPRPRLRKVAPHPTEPEISSSKLPSSMSNLSKPKSQLSPKGFPMNGLSPIADERRTARKSAKTFPVVSPPSSPTSRDAVTYGFPTLSPLSSQAFPSSSFPRSPPKSPLMFQPQQLPPIGKSRLCATDDEDEVAMASKLPLRRTNTRPFPLGSPGPSQLTRTPNSKLGKRSSPQSDPGDRKKRREDSYSPTRNPSHYFDEDDTILMHCQTDPSSLCPYCDLPLPTSPTPLLLHLLSPMASLHAKSSPDPRPGNPLGRKAPLSAFISLCQRHRFESEMLPLAERRGWPKSIAWDTLGARVENMKDGLQSLILDRTDVSRDSNGSRSRCVFWTEVINEFKAKGSRAVTGVKGQFENFEKTQPGYYGEKGSVIIHQILYNLFPPGSINSEDISPLPANEFISRVLVPEVATRLIIEDQNLDADFEMDKAVEILRESAQYGVAMFPQDGGEWGDMETQDKGNRGKRVGKKGDQGRRGGRGTAMVSEVENDDELDVADMIVMERARKRRQELEIERAADERWERDMKMQQSGEVRPRRAAARRSRQMIKVAADDTESNSDANTSSNSPRIKSKRRARPKNETLPSMDYLPSKVGAVAPKPRPRPLGVTKTATQSDIVVPDPSADDRNQTIVSNSSAAEDSDASPKHRRLRSSNADKGISTSSEPLMKVPMTKTLNAPNRRKTRRQGPAVNSDVDIDLCSSSDTGRSNSSKRAPTKGKSRAREVSPSSPGSEHNGVPSYSATNKHDPSKTPTSGISHPRHGKVHDSDEETPRPANKGRSNVIGSSGSLPPLLAARQKNLLREKSSSKMDVDEPPRSSLRKGKARDRAPGGPWLTSMATPLDDYASDDPYRSDHSANDFFAEGSKTEKHGSAWLLSDGSQSDHDD